MEHACVWRLSLFADTLFMLLPFSMHYFASSERLDRLVTLFVSVLDFHMPADKKSLTVPLAPPPSRNSTPNRTRTLSAASTASASSTPPHSPRAISRTISESSPHSTPPASPTSSRRPSHTHGQSSAFWPSSHPRNIAEVLYTVLGSPSSSIRRSDSGGIGNRKSVGERKKRLSGLAEQEERKRRSPGSQRDVGEPISKLEETDSEGIASVEGDYTAVGTENESPFVPSTAPFPAYLPDQLSRICSHLFNVLYSFFPHHFVSSLRAWIRQGEEGKKLGMIISVCLYSSHSSFSHH